MTESRTPNEFMKEPCPRCGTPCSIVNGDWLRAQRKRAGITMREMARRLDCSDAYLCDIEHNRRNCLPPVREAYEKLMAKS